MVDSAARPLSIFAALHVIGAMLGLCPVPQQLVVETNGPWAKITGRTPVGRIEELFRPTVGEALQRIATGRTLTYGDPELAFALKIVWAFYESDHGSSPPLHPRFGHLGYFSSFWNRYQCAAEAAWIDSIDPALPWAGED